MILCKLTEVVQSRSLLTSGYLSKFAQIYIQIYPPILTVRCQTITLCSGGSKVPCRFLSLDRTPFGGPISGLTGVEYFMTRVAGSGSFHFQMARGPWPAA